MLDLSLDLEPSGIAAEVRKANSAFNYLSKNERKVYSHNGVDSYLTFANAITGQGQGKLVLKGKFPEQGAGAFYLCDADATGGLRLYVYRPNSGTTYSKPISLSVSTDTGINDVVLGEVSSMEITGDFTGLKLGTILARYTSTELAETQLFHFSYEDDNHVRANGTHLETSFDSGKGFEVFGSYGRDLVTQNKTTTWDGTEADYTAKGLGISAHAMPCVVKITFLEGGAGYVKVGTAGGDSKWFKPSDGKILESVIADPSGWTGIQTSAGANKFIGTVTVEIREVPNALIYQGYSEANWSTYVQQPNGDWRAKQDIIAADAMTLGSSYWDNAQADWSWIDGKAIANTDGSSSRYLTKNLALPQYEYYDHVMSVADYVSGTIKQTVGGVVGPAIAANGTYTEEIQAGGSLSRTGARAMLGDPVNLSVPKIAIHHKIKLSDYQRNQHYIQQAEAAIAGFKAKDKSPVLKQFNGDDVYLTGPTLPAPTGKFKLGARFAYDDTSTSRNNTFLIGNVLVRVQSDTIIKVWTNTASGSTTFTVPALGKDTHELVVEMAAGSSAVTLHLDGVTIGTEDAGTILMWGSGVVTLGSWAAAHVEGRQYYCWYIDEDAPLPIGQGGNSGFWPMTEAGDTAANVYGVDAKGRQVCKVGANPNGAATWQGAPVEEQYTYDKVTGALTHPTLPDLLLSPELQRKHDLAIVLAKFAKWDNQYGKRMPLLDLNGVDQWVNCGDIAIAGAFKLTMPAVVDVLGSAALFKLQSTTLSQWLDVAYVAPGKWKIATNGHTPGNTVDDIVLGQLDTFELEWDETDFILRADGEVLYTVTPASSAWLVDTFTLKVGNGAGLYHDGKAGPLKYLDYANPLNSRYYVPMPWGMVDLMATVGDELATVDNALVPSGYAGDISVVGSDIHLTNVDSGSNSRIAVNIPNLTVGSTVVVEYTTRTPSTDVNATWYIREALDGVGNITHSSPSSDGDPQRIAFTATQEQQCLLVVLNTIGHPITLEDISIKEYPNAGIYQGNPAEPKTFIKTGDDWYHADSDTTILGA